MRPEPKFSVGEAVMIRSTSFPEQNCDFAIITKSVYENHENLTTGINSIGWSYRTNKDIDIDNLYWCESALRPLPKEKPNGINATDYIKSLNGVTA